MKKNFLFTLCVFLFIWTFLPLKQKKEGLSQEIVLSNVVQSQVDEIDRQIEELENMKRGYEARALRHEDQGERLQFEDRALLEAKRHFELAEENRLKAARIQEEIDRLKKEKKVLLETS